MDAISCLAPLLATSIADAAIARALHFSSSSSSSSSVAATTTTIISPDSSSASSHHNDLPPVPVPVPPHAASFHPVRQNHHQALALAPRGARAGKRRSRAPTTTYISTDTANFRLMVQQITGAQEADGGDVAGVDVTALQVQAARAAGRRRRREPTAAAGRRRGVGASSPPAPPPRPSAAAMLPDAGLLERHVRDQQQRRGNAVTIEQSAVRRRLPTCRTEFHTCVMCMPATTVDARPADLATVYCTIEDGSSSRQTQIS
uniref:VQ motif family protein n=1 Tax=Zea mays TaxID=4577 RepID=B6TGI9_MAIZE|nr:VQ motif family protein [Zea mays]|eukprot:NP_001149645.1 VQ motif family protein [Zea mays]